MSAQVQLLPLRPRPLPGLRGRPLPGRRALPLPPALQVLWWLLLPSRDTRVTTEGSTSQITVSLVKEPIKAAVGLSEVSLALTGGLVLKRLPMVDLPTPEDRHLTILIQPRPPGLYHLSPDILTCSTSPCTCSPSCSPEVHTELQHLPHLPQHLCRLPAPLLSGEDWGEGEEGVVHFL